MKCLDCNGRLRVTHSHSTDRSRASRAVCEVCRNVFTLVTTVLRGSERGTGAKALAVRLRSGEATLELHDSGDEVEEDTDQQNTDSTATSA